MGGCLLSAIALDRDRVIDGFEELKEEFVLLLGWGRESPVTVAQLLSSIAEAALAKTTPTPDKSLTALLEILLRALERSEFDFCADPIAFDVFQRDQILKAAQQLLAKFTDQRIPFDILIRSLPILDIPQSLLNIPSLYPSNIEELLPSLIKAIQIKGEIQRFVTKIVLAIIEEQPDLIASSSCSSIIQSEASHPSAPKELQELSNRISKIQQPIDLSFYQGYKELALCRIKNEKFDEDMKQLLRTDKKTVSQIKNGWMSINQELSMESLEQEIGKQQIFAPVLVENLSEGKNKPMKTFKYYPMSHLLLWMDNNNRPEGHLFIDCETNLVELERDKLWFIVVRKNETAIQLCFKERDIRDKWFSVMNRKS